MKVFKFGGASVKDAAAVKNVAEILKLYRNEKLTVVVSAMGKTTNALEEVARFLWEKDQNAVENQVQLLIQFHQTILKELFEDPDHRIFDEILQRWERIEHYKWDKDTQFDEVYDQIVSAGEWVSSRILTAFLEKEGLKCRWADATKLIRTNHKFREAEVDWRTTEEYIVNHYLPHYSDVDIQITQGFVGHTSDIKVTTLGREGSDFTAAIFAYCANAESVTIWKDVPGMLNADPKYFDNTVMLKEISYKEAIELSYYGASVIHPKTVKPLQNRHIPLYVRSFIEPQAEGTTIAANQQHDNTIPSFIFKMNQTLISITPRDFSFIVEENLSDIFNRLAQANAKINVMQNSALSFKILVDQNKIHIPNLLGLFENTYQVDIVSDLELVTIRHYDQATIDRTKAQKKVILEQRTEDTVRMILAD